MLENLHSIIWRLNFLTSTAPDPEHLDSTDTYSNKCTRLHDLRLKRSVSDGINKLVYERATSAQIWTETKKLVIPLSKSKVSLRSSFVNLACLFIYFFLEIFNKKSWLTRCLITKLRESTFFNNDFGPKKSFTKVRYFLEDPKNKFFWFFCFIPPPLLYRARGSWKQPLLHTKSFSQFAA